MPHRYAQSLTTSILNWLRRIDCGRYGRKDWRCSPLVAQQPAEETGDFEFDFVVIFGAASAQPAKAAGMVQPQHGRGSVATYPKLHFPKQFARHFCSREAVAMKSHVPSLVTQDQ